MYAQVIGAQLQPQKHDEACGIYNEVVLPSLKQSTGYAASLFMSDLDTGKALLMVVWRSETDLTAQFTNGRHQQRVVAFGNVLVAPVLTEVYELTAVDALARLSDRRCPGRSPAGIP
jgi:hypothetical protein